MSALEALHAAVVARHAYYAALDALEGAISADAGLSEWQFDRMVDEVNDLADRAPHSTHAVTEDDVRMLTERVQRPRTLAQRGQAK